MAPGKWSLSLSVMLLVASLTVLLSAFVLLMLSQLGFIAFTGGGWMVHAFHMIGDYLGYSVLFFLPVLLGFTYCYFHLLHSLRLPSTDPSKAEHIRFYNGGLELCITLFFAIGVLFTAWGMQNALVSALGNMNRTEAGEMGAWGILQRLVENGILVALWTTIVGGAGGYGMRMVKYCFLGRHLNRYALDGQAADRNAFLHKLEELKAAVERIETHMKPALTQSHRAIPPSPTLDPAETQSDPTSPMQAPLHSKTPEVP